MSDGIGGMNFESIKNNLGAKIAQREQELKATTTKPGFGDNIAEVMQASIDANKWSTMVSITVNLIKEVSEAMKGIVQKAA